MLKEFYQSIRATLYERSTSPLTGTFALAWISFNWRPVLIAAMSNRPIEDRISYIEQHYISWKEGLVFPFAVSLAIIFIYPKASTFVFKLWEREKLARTELRRSLQRLGTLSPTQTATLLETLENQETRYIELQGKKVLEAKELQKTLAGKEELIQKYLDEINNEKAASAILQKNFEMLNQQNLDLQLRKKEEQERSYDDQIQQLSHSEKEGLISAIKFTLIPEGNRPNSEIQSSVYAGFLRREQNGNCHLTEKGEYFRNKFLKSFIL